MKETIKDYPAFYRKFVMPKFRKRVSCVTGLDRLPTTGPYIIAANHIGSFDPPMIVSTINQHVKQLIYFVTEQYVVNIMGLRRAVETMGMIPKREHRRNECLEYAREHIEKGRIVGIFVEGMRNDGPVLLRGKSGAARLALWTKAPIYPVGFKGPGTWSVKQTIRHWTRGMNPPAEIHIGEPLKFPKYYDKEITYDMLREITTSILKALEPLSGKIYPY